MSELTLIPGAVRVNFHAQVVDDPNAKVWRIDCSSKYAEPHIVWSADAASHKIALVATSATLRTDPDAKQTTQFVVPVTGDEWHVAVSGNRYEFTVFAWKEEQS